MKLIAQIHSDFFWFMTNIHLNLTRIAKLDTLNLTRIAGCLTMATPPMTIASQVHGLYAPQSFQRCRLQHLGDVWWSNCGQVEDLGRWGMIFEDGAFHSHGVPQVRWMVYKGKSHEHVPWKYMDDFRLNHPLVGIFTETIQRTWGTPMTMETRIWYQKWGLAIEVYP